MLKETVFNLYIDESGNTGANMIDNEQKFFTYGAWLIQKSIENRSIKNLSNKYYYLFDKNNVEIKATKYFYKDKYYKKYKELFNDILKEKMYPFVLLLEKKYIISCFIVEVFFKTKNIINPIEYKELQEFKTAISNIIHNNITFYNSNIFNEFWSKNYNSKYTNQQILYNTKQEISKILDSNNLNYLSNYLANINTNINIDELKAEEFFAGILSKLLTHIIVYINYVNNYNNYKINYKINVFHDNLDGFKYIKKVIKKSNIESMLENNINFPLNTIDSKNNKIIQLADLLAGFFRILLNEKNINKYAKQIINQYFIDTFGVLKGNSVIYLSYDTEYKFLSNISKNGFPKIDIDNKKLIQYFNKYIEH